MNEQYEPMNDSEIKAAKDRALDVIETGIWAESAIDADEEAGELATVILRLIAVVDAQRVELKKALAYSHGIKGSDERDLFKVQR